MCLADTARRENPSPAGRRYRPPCGTIAPPAPRPPGRPAPFSYPMATLRIAGTLPDRRGLVEQRHGARQVGRAALALLQHHGEIRHRRNRARSGGLRQPGPALRRVWPATLSARAIWNCKRRWSGACARALRGRHRRRGRGWMWLSATPGHAGGAVGVLGERCQLVAAFRSATRGHGYRAAPVRPSALATAGAAAIGGGAIESAARQNRNRRAARTSPRAVAAHWSPW